MTRTADVAVVGGGIIGVSTAYELALAGLDVVLFDKGPLSSGTTGGSGGVVCLHDFHEIYAAFTAVGYARVRELARDHDIGYRPTGFLSIQYGEGFDETPPPFAALFDSGGTESVYHRELRDGDATVARFPWLRRPGITGSTLFTNQGYIHPYRLVDVYARLAAATGRVRVEEGTPVLGFRSRADGIGTVVTRRGAWDVGAVVNAGGPWGAKVAALAGSELALAPQRVQVAVITAFDDEIDDVPLTGVPELVAGEHVWTRGEEGGTVLVGQHHDRTLEGRTIDPDFVDRMPQATYPAAVDQVFRRYWNLDRSEVLNGWCCVYGTTSDGFPLVGRDPDVANLWHAVGLNGHGITCHAGVAATVAGLLTRSSAVLDTSHVGGPTTSVDISPLRPDRFARGERLRFLDETP